MHIDEVIEYNRLYRGKPGETVVRDAATVGSLKEVAIPQFERIEKLERRIEKLWDTVVEHAEHIEELEAVLKQSAVGLTAIIADGAEINAEVDCTLRQRVDEQNERTEKLEVMLRDVVRCLIDGSVDVNKASSRSDTFHEHRILGVGSVLTMVEVYRRLEASK